MTKQELKSICEMRTLLKGVLRAYDALTKREQKILCKTRTAFKGTFEALDAVINTLKKTCEKEIKKCSISQEYLDILNDACPEEKL